MSRTRRSSKDTRQRLRRCVAARTSHGISCPPPLGFLVTTALFAGSFVAASLVTPALVGQESTQEGKPAPAEIEDLHGPFREAFRAVLRHEPLFPGMRDILEPLPPFFRDTRLALKSRSYYFDIHDSDSSSGNAWAYGGSLAYQSGWLFETFSVGAEVFTSQRIAGHNEARTLLLEDDESYAVVGESYGQIRFRGQHLKVFRQRLDVPYLNGHDSRMTPNTFEAYTLQGTFLKRFQYIGGYVDKIKPRNQDQFIRLSERATGSGSEGLYMAGVLWTPFDRAHAGVVNHFVDDTLNVLYAESEYEQPLTNEIGLKLGFQFTDQRSVGEDLLTGASYDTRVASARLAVGFRNAILTAAFSTTDSEERIRNPWGSYPGYISLMQRNFNRADEDAWLVGLSYDFKALGAPGLSAFVNYAHGNGARDSASREHQPDQSEVDLTFDYRFHEEWVPGLWLRLRGSFLHREKDNDVTELRVIVNYEFPIF